MAPHPLPPPPVLGRIRKFFWAKHQNGIVRDELLKFTGTRMKFYVILIGLALSGCVAPSDLSKKSVEQMCVDTTYRGDRVDYGYFIGDNKRYVRGVLSCINPGCISIIQECARVETIPEAIDILQKAKIKGEQRLLKKQLAEKKRDQEVDDTAKRLLKSNDSRKICTDIHNYHSYDPSYKFLVKRKAEQLAELRGIDCSKTYTRLKREEEEEKARKEIARLEGLSPNKLCDLYSTNAQANKIAEKQGLGPFCRAYLSEKALQDERRKVVAEQNRRKQLIEACANLINSGLFRRSERRKIVQRLGGSDAECLTMFPQVIVNVPRQRREFVPYEFKPVKID